MAWQPLASTTVALIRFDMERCASGGIIRSSVVTRYQLGFDLHAGSVILVLGASTPRGTWESAMKAAATGSTSPTHDAGNFAFSSAR